MASLKDIRRRIKSVKNTRKITLAMKMVAAAKVKRAEDRLKANRPFADELRLVFSEVYESMKNRLGELEESRYADLLLERPIKRMGVVFISSDRGLCGSYNANVLKFLVKYHKNCRSNGIEPKYYLLGSKLTRVFDRYCDGQRLGSQMGVMGVPTLDTCESVAKAMMKAYTDNQIDAIQIVYTHFKSMLTYQVNIQNVLPLKGEIEEIHHDIVPEEATIIDTDTLRPHRSETLLEPSATAVLDTLLPDYMANQLYNCMLESSASELAARMTAMSNASNNASELIDKLTIDYNKARQASITQEILEIVGGAEALA
ncbi:MAG: ATP synthase F1 subunit gamma [Cyanobacteria bacterium HKST-UBA06]|nr:ATP synthase F1 subunit gamma [Cyanobacteria bacterium HKST-UBA04]MCA9808415.1 ATP synthase F1 subunit gamma [Cyanobacteria bacterium HKST-UBA06]